MVSSRKGSRLPPRLAAAIVMRHLPEETLYSDYRVFLDRYRCRLSPNTDRRAVRYACWRAADDMGRPVLDFVVDVLKHGFRTIVIKIILGG